MRSVTLVSVALTGLLCAAAPAGAAPPAASPTAPSAQQSPAIAPAAPPPAASASPRPQTQGQRHLERRRRISYASCNRESHRRKLSGGARRRFLVRCRLGYERRPSSATAPVRKP